MARKTITDLTAWPSLTLEGNLIAPAMVAQISQPKDDSETQQSYGVRKGLTIREEVSTAFRVGQSHFDTFSKLQNPTAEATRRFVRDFLKETFGFDDLVPANGAVALVAGGRVPLVIVPPEEKLDRRSPTLSNDRSRSPAVALQDYLNAEEVALWGLATNGHLIRVMRDNASLTRPAYIEADLAQIFTTEDAASFAALWLMFHRSRFGAAGVPATDCYLERWRDAGAREGEAARDRLAGQVQLALVLLGSGFLEANPDMAKALKSGEVNLTDWFNELLRLVYRLIFLMVAEDRNLLHPENASPVARKLYAEGYSLTALRAQSVRKTAWDRHHDRYEGIKIIFRALARGQESLALPALGGLFSEDKLPHLESARLRNRAFMEALFRLSCLSDGTAMVPVNWRAMETEELGSVYESLLELQPQLGADGKTLVFASEASEQKGNQRKTTGSYYTPDSLVQALLDTALDPVLDNAEAEAPNPAKALLQLSVIDPACGSGHFLLAAARRIATRLARIRAEGAPSLSDFRHALRDVARCCIHGVDRNPMAVELTKVALWIETVDPGLPLGFFDAQIRCGDSLLGIFELKALHEGIPDVAYKPLAGDDKDTAKYYLQANQAAKSGQGGFDFGAGKAAMPELRPLSVDFSGLRDLPENTVEQVGTKTARYEVFRNGFTFKCTKLAADVYVGAFLLPKAGGAPGGSSGRTVPTTEELWEALNQYTAKPAVVNAARAANRAHVFHWPLEFPDVLQRGGFDVVLGNPPWERIKLQELEFFAARNPEIANAPNKAARDKLIKALSNAPIGSNERNLSVEFVASKRESDASSEFARIPDNEYGRFRLTGVGDINTYALFAELFLSLKALQGRAGIIVPSEILSNDTSKDFFSYIIDNGLLKGAVSFENEEFIFPGIANVNRIALLTLGEPDKARQYFSFAFYLRRIEDISEAERYFELSADEIRVINPNTRTCPGFRSKTDAAITKQICKALPILVDDSSKRDGNIWNVRFQRMFDMANDSHLFLTRDDLTKSGYHTSGRTWRNNSDEIVALPLYEGKFISHYDHRFSSYHKHGLAKGRGGRGLPPVTPEEYRDHNFEVQPRYWLESKVIEDRILEAEWRRSWLLGWRDVASAKDERTLIPCVIPRYAAGHTLPIMYVDMTPDMTACLLANLSSIVCDYFVRQKGIRSHLTQHYVKQIPVLPPGYYSSARREFIVPRVLELSYTSHALTPFAQDLNHSDLPFTWDEGRRSVLRADLDAFFARAYALERDELRYILDPTDVKGLDYPSETFRVLKERELGEYRIYRTRRLVLDAWDRMEADGTFAALGLTADVARPTARPIRVQVPPLNQLPDGAWARAQPSPQHDPGAALAAILKSLDGRTPSRTVRLVAAMMLEPYLLTPFLSKDQAAHWRRLVGQEAVPRTGNVVGFVGRTKSGWGTSITNHRGNGRLVEDLNAKTWAPGPGLEVFETSGWPDGRAAFAFDAVRNLDIETTITSLPDEVRGWIADAAAA